MSACPYCHDSGGHPGLDSCPEVGRPLPISQAVLSERIDTTVKPSEPDKACPGCGASNGLAGQDLCPTSGHRLAQVQGVPCSTGQPRDGGEEITPLGLLSESKDPWQDHDQEWQLRFSWGDVVGLDEVALVIGRDGVTSVAKHCGTNISRRHVELLVGDGVVRVLDLDSMNGTFVNGIRIAPSIPHSCSTGDTVQLGAGDGSEPPLTFEIVRV